MQNYNDDDFNINFDEDVTSELRKSEEKIAHKNDRSLGIVILFLSLIFLFSIFIVALFHNATSNKRLPALEITKKEPAKRGTIYSSDGLTLANSKNLYKISVMKKSINPDKMELFLNMLSVYGSFDRAFLNERLESSGNIILSYSVSPRVAQKLKELNYKLLRNGVFRSYEDNGRIYPKSGLSIEISGESREYLYNDLIEPILGYTNKLETDGFTKPRGMKGIEGVYNSTLDSKSDGIYKGARDIGFNVVLQKKATIEKKMDGRDIVLTIPLKLQKKIENIVDEAALKFNTNEIIVGIMDSNNGKILALASSKRFNPQNIKERDYSSLNSRFVEHSYEPGSVMKPIVYAILLEKNLIKPNEIFNLHNGIYKLGGYRIRDTIKKDYASAENIIILSSNIGMVQMAQRLEANSYYIGLQAFGLSFPTNIDLPYEKNGLIPSVSMLNSQTYKGSVSYGYGIRATMLQLMRAYAIFGNGGFLVTPYLRDYTIINRKKADIKKPEKLQVLSHPTAQSLQNTLIKTFEQNAKKINGINIGGKTGTAKIAQKGGYGDKYISSFFGFANDVKNSYTIGVVLFETSQGGDYYASQTARPIAIQVSRALIQEGYLKQIEP